MKSKIKKNFKTIAVVGTLLFCACLVLIASQFRAYASTPTPVASSTAMDAGTPTPGATPTPAATPTVGVTPSPSPQPTPTATAAPSPTKAPAPSPTQVQRPTVVPTIAPTKAAGPTFYPTAVATATIQPTASPTAKATASPTVATPTVTNTTANDNSQNIDASSQQKGTATGATSNNTTLLFTIILSTTLLLFVAAAVALLLLRRNAGKGRPTFRTPLTPTAPASASPWAIQQQIANMSQPLDMPVLPQTPTPTIISPQTSPSRAFSPLPDSVFGPDAPTVATSVNMTNAFSGKLPAIPPAQTTPQPLRPTPPPPAGITPQPLRPTPPPPAMMSPTTPQLSPTDTYLPSDLRPITSPLPKQRRMVAAQQTQINPISSDMNPLLPDSFDIAQIMGSRAGTQSQQVPGPNAQSTVPAMQDQQDTTQPVSAVVPPNIQDDPVLETIMRQAQMGLYAPPAPSTNLDATQQRNAANNNTFLL